MSMSKKDFISMAIEFGDLKRWATNSGDDQTTEIQLNVIERSINAYMRVARKANSAFDSDTFTSFVNDVASGTRDLDGRKVKKAKVSL